jgi:hypothetical protein
MMITRPMIASDHDTPLSAPNKGESKSWIETITQETAIYKGFKMLSINTYLLFRNYVINAAM